VSRSPEGPRAKGLAEDLPEALWREARDAQHRLLLMDYDGTLAPFHLDPLEAHPVAGAAALLERIVGSAGTRVAVISGRPVVQLRRLLDVGGITFVGEHGWEIWDPGTGLSCHPLPPAVAESLVRVSAAARREPWVDRLEEKRTSLVLHTRGMPEEEAFRVARSFCDLWLAQRPRIGLSLQPIDGGMELRATDRDKGFAVRDILSTLPPDVFSIYLGDEWTDEDAFRALAGRGTGIRVGPAERPSHAQHRLAGPEEVVEFLRRWVAGVEAARPAVTRGSS
jgi:trehalose-phosphatase